MVKWIIQNNLIKENVLNLFRNAFRQHNIVYEEVIVIPFSAELPNFEPVDQPVFYGSTTLMMNAYHSKYSQGVFFEEEKFTVENYQKYWGNRMLNRQGQIWFFHEFIESAVDLQQEWFIRPNDDTKSFAGQVMSSEDIKEWYQKIVQMDSDVLNAHTMIFADTPKTIIKEWRNFIVNKKVVDTTRYMFGGELNISCTDVPSEMIEFVENSCVEYVPHDIFVMDIAQIPEGFFIVEANCFNGTGFYEHNIGKIVKSITNFLK